MVNIYVLKLKGNKYYVGKTNNPIYRLNDHFSEDGSAWTRKYKPISIHELRPNRTNTDEQLITQEYMEKYGIDNVRGGPWCKMSLTETEKQMITHIIHSNSDICYKCGKQGHFSANCEKKNNRKKIQPSVCDRCGRSNHTIDNCYATTHIDDYLSEEEEVDVWCCSYCSKEFGSKKGASYHERFHCKQKTCRGCKRCGRSGHTKSECYATSHTKGYYLD